MRSPKRLPLFFLALLLSSIAHGKEPLPINKSGGSDTPARCSRTACSPPPNDKYVDGITLTITSKPFDPKAHTLTKCKEMMLCESEKDGQPVYYMCNENLCSIDGKPVYGTNGKTPKQEVTSLIFEKNGRKVALDVSGMYNPYVNNSNIKQYVQVIPWLDKSYWVTGYFSHGDGDADMYIGLWTVTPDGSFRNYMGDFESLHYLTERVVEDFKYKSLETIMRENQRE